MSKDITSILEGWTHEPGKISVRKIRGKDGRVKIQLRLDLGLLQMETEGRPDGRRPHDCESLLEYSKQLLARHRRRHGSKEDFTIDEKHCELLRSEAIQYYYRYLSQFVLEDYEAVARDTGRNLEVLDFCAKYADEESDRYIMEQYRPYILMMNTRARGYLALRDNRSREAGRIVKEALSKMERFFNRFGQEDIYGSSSEVAVLEALLKEIEAKIPRDPLKQLKDQLVQAVEDERYEEAARLRDAIHRAARQGTSDS